MSYRPVDEVFWTDPKVRALNSDAKLLFLYLITNPHASFSGMYYLPLPTVIFETGLSQEIVRMGIDTLSDGYMVLHDEENSIFWVVNMAKFQVQSEKQRQGARQCISKLQKTGLLQVFALRYPEILSPDEYPLDTHSIPYRNNINVNVNVNVNVPKNKASSEELAGAVINSAHQVNDEPKPENEAVGGEKSLVGVISHEPGASFNGKAKNGQDAKKKRDIIGAVFPEVEIPQSLNSEIFVKAWGEWMQHLKEKRKRPTPSSLKKQLMLCAALGADLARKTIERSIQNNWIGLFPENGQKDQFNLFEALKNTARSGKDGDERSGCESSYDGLDEVPFPEAEG